MDFRLIFMVDFSISFRRKFFAVLQSPGSAKGHFASDSVSALAVWFQLASISSRLSCTVVFMVGVACRGFQFVSLEKF